MLNSNTLSPFSKKSLSTSILENPCPHLTISEYNKKPFTSILNLPSLLFTSSQYKVYSKVALSKLLSSIALKLTFL